MPNQYFANFPKIKYQLETGNIIRIKDIFRKVTIEPEALDSMIEYTSYEIHDGERPDIVATKLYGDADLHWLFYLTNNFDNYYQWYKSFDEFEEYISQKYPGYILTASNTTDIVSSSSKFLLGEKISSSLSTANVIFVDPTFKRVIVDRGSWTAGDVVTGANSGKSFTVQSVQNHRDGVSHYKNSDGVVKNTSSSGFSSVSFYEEELEINEKRRSIKVLKRHLVKPLIAELDRLLG